MDTTIYESILKELLADSEASNAKINELETQIIAERNKKNDTDSAIKVIQAKINAINGNNGGGAKHPLQFQENNSFRADSPVTLSKGSEQILADAGKPLYIDRIVEELEKRFGRVTTKRSLNSTLIQDPKRRFVLLGKNYFDLTTRANSNSNTANLFPQPDTTQKTEFSLIEAVRSEIKKLGDKEFQVNDIYNALHEKFPNEVDEARRRSVGSTINNLMLKGEVEKTRVGSFDKPAIFKAKSNLW